MPFIIVCGDGKPLLDFEETPIVLARREDATPFLLPGDRVVPTVDPPSLPHSSPASTSIADEKIRDRFDSVPLPGWRKHRDKDG